METAQERELQLQGWPFHAMPASFDAGGGSSISSDCFLLGWEPPFDCFADAHLHDLFPFCMEPLPVSPDATSTPNGELGDLLLNFWDANCYGDASEQPVAVNSSCVPQHEKSSQSSAATATNSFLYDDGDPLGSIFSKRPSLPEEAVFQAPLLSSSSSSGCHAPPDPLASHACGAQTQDTTIKQSGSSSLKRATPQVSESTEVECSQSGAKRWKAVVCPFAVLKPDGLDGGATLADINARLLMRPARPVPHPVGEFACAPLVLAAGAPGISGRAVSGFTRLHTPGRGTITIMRTRG